MSANSNQIPTPMTASAVTPAGGAADSVLEIRDLSVVYRTPGGDVRAVDKVNLDLAAGERGLLSLPAGSAAFRDNIDVCVGIAVQTGCTVLNALYGNRVDGVPEELQDELALENLALAARAAVPGGATVVVEALNSYDSPRAPLVSSQSALAVINEVRARDGVSNIAFLADLYHLGKMGEDLPEMLARDAADIAHIQIADVPDRGAPGTGELDFPALFEQIAEQGYTGSIGCEYKPSDPADSSTSFGWR